MQIAVTFKGGEWGVLQDGVIVSEGMSRSAAVELAEAMAFNAESSGRTVELLVQSYTGEFAARHSGGE